MTEPVGAEFLALQQVLAGRYSLERELGRGGMGIVFLARDVALDRPVAIKLLPPLLAAQPPFHERFLREARTAARLSHPNIVSIYAVEERGELVFFVMAYVNGETLRQRVERAGPLTIPEATRLLQEVAWALAYAHNNGIVHRDVKPDNVLIERAAGRALVSDFGVARVTDAAAMTGVGEIVGTVHYMSPEQAAGDPVDARSDLYSLGVTAFYALTGNLPFEAPTQQALMAMVLAQPAPPVASLRPELPTKLAEAVDRCLAKEAGARFSSGEELADHLAVLIERAPQLPPSIRSFQQEADTLAVEAGGYAMVLLLEIGFTASVTDAAGRVTSLFFGAFKLYLAALLAVLWSMRLLQVVYRARQVLAAGLTFGDVQGALRDRLGRVGGQDPVRDADLKAGEFSSLAVFLAGMGLEGILLVLKTGDWPSWVVFGPLLVAGALTGVGFGRMLVVAVRRRTKGRGSVWGRVWSGWIGRVLFKLAGLRLRVGPQRQRVPPGAPTDLASAHAIEAVFDGLPSAHRKRFGHVPDVIRRLEADARAMRRRETELDQAMGEAGAERVVRDKGRLEELRAAPGKEREVALLQRRLGAVAELGAARRQARDRLASAVAALENIRIDLLRLRAGIGTPDALTADLEAAREIGREIDAELAGREEVGLLVDTPPLARRPAAPI